MIDTFGASALEQAARTLRGRSAWGELSSLLDGHPDDVRTHPELATLRGEAYLRTGAPREGRTWFTEAIPVIERRGDRSALRRAINMLGVAEFQLGLVELAEPEFERAVQLGQEDGDDLLVARATNNLGMIANMRGERERALGLYAISVTAYQRLGDASGLAAAHHNMAISFRDAGDLERAEEHELRAIEFARQAENPILIAQARLGRAEIRHRSGDAPFAEVGARRAAADFASLGERIQQADALRLQGVAALAQGKADIAETAIERALLLTRERGSALTEAEVLEARAALWLHLGNYQRMRDDAGEAIRIFERLQAHHSAELVRGWLTRAEHRPTLPRGAVRD